MLDTLRPETIRVTERTDIDAILQQAVVAFHSFKKKTPDDRALFLESIAEEIEKRKEELVAIACGETHLTTARLHNELGRTTGQLRKFAALIKEGSWVEASIDTADLARNPPKVDIRKMLVPVGPVVVFGASNFPFAFSTAGGDTASALASGSTVIIKGHSAHAATSQGVFEAIEAVIEKIGMPKHTVQHVLGSGNTEGKALVMHPLTKGVGFTGSFSGGKALVEYSAQREAPIPVFAEMSSINPVVFFPDALEANATAMAQQFAASITLGVGQFCTNPGILLGMKSEALDQFLAALATEISTTVPQKMLHSGIHASYEKGLSQMQAQNGLQLVGQSAAKAGALEGQPLVAKVSGTDFTANPHFAEEVFGPFALAVVCSDSEELIEVLKNLKGQLTTTMMATAKDIDAYSNIIAVQHDLAGRIILNNVPTGVEVCASMVHGGPYPATTDARFTSVGTTAIKRWVRPLCFQNFTPNLLPDALKNENPLRILRLVNDTYTREPVGQHTS